MDDFSILGIAETRDPRLVKEAFRARAKELHPDMIGSGGDPLEGHYLFIALVRAYRRALAGCASPKAPARSGAEEDRPAASAAGPVPPARTRGEGFLALHKDPAYVLYRTGMRYYMAIHPAAWNLGSRTSDEEMKAKVGKLLGLFPKAYYYFGLVTSEHADSPWAADARDKMDVIERRSSAYRKILESFGAWRRAGKERGRELAGIVDRTRKLLKEEGGELRWPKSPGSDRLRPG
jgi:hypothetical protein